MSKIMKIKISLLVMLTLIFQIHISKYAFAEVDTKKDLVVSDIQKGQRAPYNGVLMTQRLVTEIKNNYGPEVAKSKCSILIKQEVGLANSQCIKDTTILESKISSCEDVYKKSIDLKNKEIVRLSKLLEPNKWYKDNKLWFGLGVGVGIALSGTTVYFISKM